MTNYNNPLATDPTPGPIAYGGGSPVFSAFSIIAVIMALLALFGSIGYSFLLAIGAVIFGLIGMLVAILPGKRGGIMSFFAVGVGLLAIIIALFRLIGHAASSV